MKRQRWMTFAMIVLIFVGLGIMLYPTANDVYNRWKANREIEKYNQVAEAEQADYSDLWEAAEAYNRRLARNGSFSGTVDAAQQQEVAGLLNPLGTGMMGYIDIPHNEEHRRSRGQENGQERGVRTGCEDRSFQGES